MNSGYIKLHRKILDNPLVMKSSDHFALWMYLLLNAAHKKYDTLIGSERVTLNPGQLVTGRKKIAKDLKINDPFYMNGNAKKKWKELGRNIIHEKKDFYEIKKSKKKEI